MILKNQRGQSLIEYVILVALVGVGTIGMVRILSQTVDISVANVVGALGTHTNFRKHETHEVTRQDLRKADFSNFMNNTHSSSDRGQHE